MILHIETLCTIANYRIVFAISISRFPSPAYMLRLLNILEIKIMKKKYKYMIFVNALEKCVMSNISTLEIYMYNIYLCLLLYVKRPSSILGLYFKDC